MKIFVLLQNAWARDARGAELFREHPDFWKAALKRSRSGQRLRRIFNTEERWDEAIFSNTTPEVAIGSSGKRLPANITYVRAQLSLVQPELILACGKQSYNAMSHCVDLAEKLVCMPHPACRVWPNRMLDDIRELIFPSPFPTIRVGSLGDNYCCFRLGVLVASGPNLSPKVLHNVETFGDVWGVGDSRSKAELHSMSVYTYPYVPSRRAKSSKRPAS